MSSFHGVSSRRTPNHECGAGLYNLCADVVFLATPPVDGAFTDYLVIDEDFAFALPDELSDDAGALIEPLSVGIWACRKARVGAGDRVLITGAGPIGLLAMHVARASGATQKLVSVAGQTTDRPFNEELALLLSERRLSQRKLSQLVDLNPAHLSRVIRGADRARPSIDLINRIADALELPNDYFPEQRVAAVIEMIKRDPALRDQLYAHLQETPTAPG